jgi:uncharacterized protein YkwD
MRLGFFTKSKHRSGTLSRVVRRTSLQRSLDSACTDRHRFGCAHLFAATIALSLAALFWSASPGLAASGENALTDPRVITAAATSALAAAKPVRLRGLERQVLRQLNQYRRKNGRKAIKAQKQLLRAAVVHGKAMAARGFFEHESANGESFDTRVKRYYRTKGFRSWSVGENLVWASGTLSAKRAIALWRNSPGHNRNMLARDWRHVGVAAVRIRSAPGVFGGMNVTIVVTDFGTRS